MTIRKNFIFDEEIAQHLKELAKRENTTQTQVIRNMIEEKYQVHSVQEKLEAFYSFAGSMNGLIGDDVSIQSIKAEMGSKI
ncbi:MAG: hypothetical protein KAJ49_07300 [Arcobacteraceae bacterium]|nr:hypothetical protein [Arcobacteraceae bacterium]